MPCDPDGTTKAQVERVALDVEVFCDTARGLVSSFMPIGLGKGNYIDDSLTR